MRIQPSRALSNLESLSSFLFPIFAAIRSKSSFSSSSPAPGVKQHRPHCWQRNRSQKSSTPWFEPSPPSLAGRGREMSKGTFSPRSIWRNCSAFFNTDQWARFRSSSLWRSCLLSSMHELRQSWWQSLRTWSIRSLGFFISYLPVPLCFFCY